MDSRRSRLGSAGWQVTITTRRSDERPNSLIDRDANLEMSLSSDVRIRTSHWNHEE
jgi:hypothetical protein